MAEWSENTYDPNDTKWVRFDPVRGVPYEDADPEWSEQPTQPQPVIRPDDRYQRTEEVPAPFWPQEQPAPMRDTTPAAEAATRERRPLVWGGLALGAILLAAMLALLIQLGLPGSHITVAPIQAGPHSTPLPTATTKPTPTPTPQPTATPTPKPTATPAPSPTPKPSPSPTPVPSPTPLPTPLPTAAPTVAPRATAPPAPARAP